MEQADVLNQVTAELAHIPSWPGEYQGLLRAIYRLFRTTSLLGSTGTGGAGAVLHHSLATVRRDYPDAQIEYDRTFFDE